jgi:type IV pilus assembly protein PilB
MNESLKNIPSKVPLENLDAGVLGKDRIEQLIRGGKMPPADAIVDEILLRTVKLDATDLLLEPAAAGLRIKLGHEGTLRTFVTIPQEIAENITSVLKTKSGLNAFEKKAPQQGRFTVAYGTTEFDFRINTLPMGTGERVALSVTDKNQTVRGIDDLNFIPDNLAKIRQLLRKPYGMVIISGPAGSGKTTTAYAILDELHRAGKDIITYEDPIAFQLDFASQLSRDREKEASFSDSVMQILRQRPDVLLCGDVRDPDTGMGSVDAALNGLLVVTTIIATDAIGTIFRFADLGIPVSKLASSINGVIHQRFLRNICTHCAGDIEMAEVPPRIAELAPGRKTFRKGTGCDQCQKTGYSGRGAVREVLVLSDEMRDLLYEKASIGRIKETAIAEGYVNIRTVAAGRVLEGLTSVDEYLRVMG